MDKAEGLVLSDVSVLTGPSNSPEKGTSCDDGSVAVSPPKPDRAALYRYFCQEILAIFVISTVLVLISESR